MDEMLGQFGPPLATGARDAKAAEGNCGMCYRRLYPGQRIADLYTTGEPVHVSCIAAQVQAEAGPIPRWARRLAKTERAA